MLIINFSLDSVLKLNQISKTVWYLPITFFENLKNQNVYNINDFFNF